MAEVLETRVNKIQETLGRHDVRIESLEKSRDKTEKTLDSINSELKSLRLDYAHRPTWTVTVVLGILTTLVGSLAVYIVTHIGG